MGPEAKIEQAIRRYAERRGVLCYKFSSPAHRGVPDRMFVANGKVLFLEIKAPGNRPTKLQSRELQKLTDAGVMATWVDNLTSAMTLIDKL